VGDGVNIIESNDVGLDYRGQRYSFDEAIFHTPGLHVFPGEKEVFPAEYHIHFRTLTAPLRGVTIVIPVSHRVTGVGSDYFAAISRQPDPMAQRPTLASLLIPGTDVLQYQGTDIRGRTADTPQPASCGDKYERQFLLVLRPCAIYASDLERIPREGSLSTNPSDLPAPGIKNKQQMPSDRAKRTLLLARPGILGGETMTVADGLVGTPGSGTELQCKPVRVVDGRDVVDMSGETIDVRKLLGLDGGSLSAKKPPTVDSVPSYPWYARVLMGLCFYLALLFADWVVRKVAWRLFFKNIADIPNIKLKIIFFLAIAVIYGVNAK
jgi:hypothetical protein